jgi:hypothetical protein
VRLLLGWSVTSWLWPDSPPIPSTANRALLWGTVLAVWTVAGVSVKAARSLGIRSARDFFGLAP